MSKTYRGENRNKNKKHWVKFKEKRKKRTIPEDKKLDKMYNNDVNKESFCY